MLFGGDVYPAFCLELVDRGSVHHRPIQFGDLAQERRRNSPSFVSYFPLGNPFHPLRIEVVVLAATRILQFFRVAFQPVLILRTVFLSPKMIFRIRIPSNDGACEDRSRRDRVQHYGRSSSTHTNLIHFWRLTTISRAEFAF